MLSPALTGHPLFNPLLATEDSPEPGVSADMQKGSKGTSGVGAHTPHTSATITGNGERTLRSLTNRNSTSGDVGHSAPVPRETGSTPPHGAGDDAQLGSKPPAASRALGGDKWILFPRSFSSSINVLTGPRTIKFSVHPGSTFQALYEKNFLGSLNSSNPICIRPLPRCLPGCLNKRKQPLCG